LGGTHTVRWSPKLPFIKIRNPLPYTSSWRNA
jgi:hypothetical protein